MFKKSIVLMLLMFNMFYGSDKISENKADEPKDPITILEQRLSTLDDREQECRNKSNEKTLTGRNITVGGFAIGLSMFIASFFVSDKTSSEPLMGFGFLTAIGSPVVGAFVGASDFQELNAITAEKMAVEKQLGAYVYANLVIEAKKQKIDLNDLKRPKNHE